MKRKENKEYSINIRCTETEKETIKKFAKKENLSLSKYVQNILFIGSTSKNTSLVVKVQEILNYIEDTYTEDKILKKQVEEIWEML